MVIGLVLHSDHRRCFSIVCSLTKELDRFYSNSGEIEQKEKEPTLDNDEAKCTFKKDWFAELLSEISNAFEAFKAMQRTYPKKVVIYRLPDGHHSLDDTLY